MIFARHDAGQRRSDRGAVVLRQDCVEGRAPPFWGDENGNVVRMVGPDALAGPPRLRALRGRSDHRPLKDLRMKVSSASTIPLSFLRLVGGRSAQKPMPPAKRRRRMHPAKLGRLGQAFAFDHRPSVVEPTLPFVQMRHRRLGERIEGGARSSCSGTAKAHA